MTEQTAVPATQDPMLTRKCRRCHGDRLVGGQPCPLCRGAGSLVYLGPAGRALPDPVRHQIATQARDRRLGRRGTAPLDADQPARARAVAAMVEDATRRIAESRFVASLAALRTGGHGCLVRGEADVYVGAVRGQSAAVTLVVATEATARLRMSAGARDVLDACSVFRGGVHVLVYFPDGRWFRVPWPFLRGLAEVSEADPALQEFGVGARWWEGG